MCQAGVAFEACVAKRRVFVAPESEDRLVHMLGVEYLKPYKKMKVLDRQASDDQEQVGLQLGNDILKRVLAEIRY